MDRGKRLEIHFSKRIIEMFSEGIPREFDEDEKEISYEEALRILDHTISVIGKEAKFILK